MRKIMEAKYPDWFSPYSPTFKYNPPSKVIVQYDVIEDRNDDFDCYIDIPLNCDSILIETLGDLDNASINISFCKKKEVPNPDYEKQLSAYQKELLTYQSKMTEWEKLKQQYDEDQSRESLDSRKRLYLKLKEEFDNNNTE